MTQGGSNGDVVIADALAKGVTGIDYRKAYEALVKNAEVDSPRPLYEGRALAEYKQLGYVSMNYPRSTSRTVGIRLQRFLCWSSCASLWEAPPTRKYLSVQKTG